jgi:hypothetical protein
MSEHTRTGRTSLRLVKPDEQLAPDPFAAPALRYRAPGTAPRPVPRPLLPSTGQARAPDQRASDDGTGPVPAPEREKPS